jgi:Piwi domain
MLIVRGHELFTPSLRYRSAHPRNPPFVDTSAPTGSWNLQNMFVEPDKGRAWPWLELSPPTGRCNDKERKYFLRTMGTQLGNYCQLDASQVWNCSSCCRDGNQNAACHFFNYSGQLQKDISDGARKKLLAKGLEHFKKNNIRILLVILPKKDPASFAALKKIADVDAGIHTTCIVRHPNWKPNMKEYKGCREYDIHELKCDPGAAANILHKVNLRLGGQNVLLNSHHNREGQLFIREAMILEADVTHPGVGSMKECPSVAAVVGSFDREFNLYSASIRCQTSKKESIEAFGEMVRERLDLWKEKMPSHMKQVGHAIQRE